LCRGSARAGGSTARSAGTMRTRPSPSAKPAAPSRAKAQAVTGASQAMLRVGGGSNAQRAFKTSSFIGRNAASDLAGFEALLQRLAIEIAADEDQLAAALVAVLPGIAPVGIHQHVHALEHVATRRALDIEDALGAEDVRSLALQQLAHPTLELV